jgi:hypothetical protein
VVIALVSYAVGFVIPPPLGLLPALILAALGFWTGFTRRWR